MPLRPTSVAVSADLVRPPMLTHGLLEAQSGIRHGFFTREGGISTGLYRSLNCGIGSQDDRALVFKNRARAATTLGVHPTKLATPYQVHGIDAMIVNHAWRPGEGPQADALVTDRPGIALGVSTADCGPVLFVDGYARVIGAAHAGWKGALAGVLESTVNAMEHLGARRDNIVAVLGPTISQRNYEVGPEVVDRFLYEDRESERFFIASRQPRHAMFDLPGYIVSRLWRAGLAVADIGFCTYADEERFFSYRRATHKRERDYGRLLSAIALAD